MATQYNVEMQISADPQSWIGIEDIMKKESNCTCLYIFYHGDFVDNEEQRSHSFSTNNSK